MIFDVTLPLQTYSPNVTFSKHWTFRKKVSDKQKKYIWFAWKKEKPEMRFPCIITLTRIASRDLDSDNLAGCFKNIRDQIASLIFPGLPMGQADDDPRLEWRYRQEKGTRNQQIRITIEGRDENED